MRTANNEPLSPLLFLHRASRLYSDKTAVIYDDKKLNYGEFTDQCLRLASALQTLGVGSGDRVAYLCDNGIEMLVAHYGVALCGAILVPINKRLDVRAICNLLLHSEAIVLICDINLLSHDFHAIVKKIITVGGAPADSTLSYNKLLSLQQIDSQRWVNWPENEQDPISLNYTSGTSGHPKGVLCSHRSVYLNALGECIHTQLNMQSNYLWVLPMFHCNGWCFTWAVTAVGATHVFVKSLDIENIITTLFNEKITHFCAAPTVLIKLRESNRFAELASLKSLTILTAGSSPPPSLIFDYISLGIRLIHVYGMTETHGPHLICEEQEHWKNYNDVNRAMLIMAQGVPSIHGVFARVVNESNSDVAQDGKSIGEVILRGNNIMLGYFKDSFATAQALRDGWLRTGDAAVVDQMVISKLKTV